MTADFDLYLASASPRRRELLAQVGLRYRLLAVDVEEQPAAGEAAEIYTLRVALDKARAGRAELLGSGPQSVLGPVLGADTAVVLNGRILGKPRDRDDALAMLAALSGARHEVFCAVALIDTDGAEHTRLSVTHVSFAPITPAQARAYWDSGEPLDKAGAYAIQGRAAQFVTRIEGSYSGVVGLPLFETLELLAGCGIRPLG